MLFQDAPPDTSGYMIAGYVMAFSVMAIYLISLVIRSRNLERELRLLERLQAESKPRSGAKAKASPPGTSGKK